MENATLNDVDIAILAVLKAKKGLRVKEMNDILGSIKATFEEEGGIPDSLKGLNSCADEIPRSLKKMIRGGMILREGNHPKRWTYKVLLDPDITITGSALYKVINEVCSSK